MNIEINLNSLRKKRVTRGNDNIINFVIKKASQEYGIKIDEFKSKRKPNNILFARYAALGVIYEFFGDFKNIGLEKHFNRDRTTFYSNLEQFKALIKYDKGFNEIVNNLRFLLFNYLKGIQI